RLATNPPPVPTLPRPLRATRRRRTTHPNVFSATRSPCGAAPSLLSGSRPRVGEPSSTACHAPGDPGRAVRDQQKEKPTTMNADQPTPTGGGAPAPAGDPTGGTPAAGIRP